MLISEDYRTLNTGLHKNPAYGISGQRYAEDANMVCEKLGCSTLLDYGCGKGTLKTALRSIGSPIAVTEYDPAIIGKDAPAKPADMVFSSDVMEHIEPELLYNVLSDIAALSRKAAFLIIHNDPAKKILQDGRNAHLIVQPAEWWHDTVSKHIEIINFTPKQNTTYIVGRPYNRVELETGD